MQVRTKKICPRTKENFVHQTWSIFAQNSLIHWEIWKLNFPHTKWVKTLVIFSKFEFQKNAQNLLIETQNNNYILHEKARQMKKTFCFNFCAYHCLWKNVSTSDLRCLQLPRLKKGNLGNISKPPSVHFSASASKNFSSIPFFLPR